jgi:hypothetical protein
MWLSSVCEVCCFVLVISNFSHPSPNHEELDVCPILQKMGMIIKTNSQAQEYIYWICGPYIYIYMHVIQKYINSISFF